MIFRILLLNLALVALKTNAEEKDSPPVKIKYMTSRAEVFKGEMITVQCLVTSHEQNWDEITVEINRSVFNSSVPNQQMSSNGEVQSEEPHGQKYIAYVQNTGDKTKEHAFRIQNIDIDNDSGVYECLVKHNDKIVDRKNKTVEVITEELPPAYPTRSYKKQIEKNDNPKSLTTTIDKLMCHEERKAKKNFNTGENLTDHVYYRDIEAPVVCHPKKQPIVIQELGQTASLSCRAEAHPSPQITWFKETYDTDSTEPTLVQIHHEPTKNDKQTQTIDVFGDFFQQVTLDINEVRDEDYGKYVCKAINNHGNDSLRISLEKPPIYSSGTSITMSSILMIFIFSVGIWNYRR